MTESEEQELLLRVSVAEKKVAEAHHYSTVMINALCCFLGVILQASPKGVEVEVPMPGNPRPVGVLGQLVFDVSKLKAKVDGKKILDAQGGLLVSQN